jgi:hemoglobin-like flavoprotein
LNFSIERILHMTPEQKALVQETWLAVAPISDQAAELFYGRLFELNPALKQLFKSDMNEQGKKLMQMIGFCVAGLDRLDELVPAVEALGRRHVNYGVMESHYDTVGAALLWTLEQGLGEAFTPQVEQAWSEVYQTLAGTMISVATAAA